MASINLETAHKQKLTSSLSINNNVESKLLQKSIELALFGERRVFIVCQSVLAASIDRTQLKRFLEFRHEALDEFSKSCIGEHKHSMGQYKFASLRKTFLYLLKGEKVRKHAYTFRVDAIRLGSAMKFLQESLQVKPGSTRNITVAGTLFQNMPIYERGGKRIDDIFKS